jgi:hypothetical protein
MGIRAAITPLTAAPSGGAASPRGSPVAASSPPSNSGGTPTSALRRVVERTTARLLAYRRPAARYDRQAATMLGLLRLTCSLICVRFFQHAGLTATSF